MVPDNLINEVEQKLIVLKTTHVTRNFIMVENLFCVEFIFIVLHSYQFKVSKCTSHW